MRHINKPIPAATSLSHSPVYRHQLSHSETVKTSSVIHHSWKIANVSWATELSLLQETRSESLNTKFIKWHQRSPYHTTSENSIGLKEIYTRGETVQTLRDFQNTVSYVKLKKK